MDKIAAASALVRDGLPITHAADLVGMNYSALRATLIRIGAYEPLHGCTPWSDHEDAFIRRHYKRDLSAAGIAEHLGRTRNEVIGRARRLGLATPAGQLDTKAARIRAARAAMPNASSAEIAKSLGIHPSYVWHTVWRDRNIDRDLARRREAYRKHGSK